jgi:hypothetical protein
VLRGASRHSRGPAARSSTTTVGHDFYTRHADGEAKVRIDMLEVIDSTLDRRHRRLVLAWALHRTSWPRTGRALAGETVHDIEPLR